MMQELDANNEITIKVGDKEFKLTKEFVTFEAYEKTVQEEKYTPSVIEPSFGKFRSYNFSRYWQNCLLYLRTLLQAKRRGCSENLLCIPTFNCSS